MKRATVSNTFLPSRAASWTRHDLRLLRELAAQGCPVEIIAKRLRRTVSSVRNKSQMQGVSLTVRAPTAPATIADARTLSGSSPCLTV